MLASVWHWHVSVNDIHLGREETYPLTKILQINTYYSSPYHNEEYFVAMACTVIANHIVQLSC